MAIVSFTTKFNLTGTPAFNFTDTSNYAGQGIPLANVVGDFTITSPSGIVIYNNTTITNAGCDIDIVSALTNQLTIPLPLTLAGLVEPGVYTITYSVWDSNLLTWSTKTNTYTYSFIKPVLSIEQTVDCLSPLFTSTDTTNYTVDSVVPAKTEVHTIDYPYGSAGESTPTVGSSLAVTTSTFYQGTQTTEISSTLTYTYPDGLIVYFILTGSKEVIVDCKDVCGIYCCIRSIEQQMEDYKITDKVLYKTYSDLFAKIMGYVSLTMIAIRCGKSADVNNFLTEIRTLSHCTSDCGCSGDDPVQVTGLGGLVNNIVVNSCGTPITVTPVQVGNTITYTVCLGASFVNQVNALYNTIVVGRNAVTVDDSGVIGGLRTFTVDGDDTTLMSNDGSIDVVQVYLTSGVLNIGTKYIISNYIAPDDFVNVGAASNASGVIFIATGTTPTTWANLSEVNVYGERNYDISKNLHGTRVSKDLNTPFVIADALNQTVTGVTGVAAVAGTYLIIYEGDGDLVTAPSSFAYRLYNITSSTVLSDDRACVNFTAVTVQSKIMCTAIAVLSANDNVALKVDSTAVGNSILGRSITMLKIA